ncbi:MAG: UvrB/UvrC motif-containing protein [Candidatus Falkowbacteria bacterium]|nr:UvrB/UvrC motif-containing protein [Candidatus Falkowbacteria bacterium]
MAKLPEDKLKKKEAELHDLKDRESAYIDPAHMLVRGDGECFINEECKYSNKPCDLMILRVTKLWEGGYVACVNEIDHKWEKQSLRCNIGVYKNIYGEVIDFGNTPIEEILKSADDPNPSLSQHISVLSKKMRDAINNKDYELAAFIRELIKQKEKN